MQRRNTCAGTNARAKISSISAVVEGPICLAQFTNRDGGHDSSSWWFFGICCSTLDYREASVLWKSVTSDELYFEGFVVQPRDFVM